MAAALSGGSYCSNSSRVLHHQQKPWHWAVLGGAVTALRKHLNKWFFSYVGVKSSASSECKFSIYQTMVPCNSLGSQRLLFSPSIFPPHTGATRSSLACNRSRRTYPMELLRNTFNFAWTSKGNSPSSRSHSWFGQLSFLTPKQRHDSLHGAERCTAQYF